MTPTSKIRIHKLFVLGTVLLAACMAARADEIRVVVAGKEPRPLECYRIGSVYYLDAGQAAPLYRAQMYWRPRSGRVLLSLHGSQVQFSVGSDKVMVGGKAMTLSSPVIVRTDRAFVPIDFFASKEFAALSGFVSEFSAQSKVLAIDRKITVGPLQWFSYKDRTRIVLALEPGLEYSIARRGSSGLQMDIPEGRVDSFVRVSVKDGIVETLRLDQEPEENPKIARLSVKFEPGVTLWKSREDLQPRRFVLDVFKDRKALDSFLRAIAAPKSAAGSSSTPAQKSALVPVQTGSAAVPAVPSARKRYRIAIDAGHGGKDGGTRGAHKTLEKDINLRAALELAKLLKDSGDFDVLLTRQDDTFVPLSQRSKEADNFHADIFVSLHCNAASNRAEGGFEIYFLSEKASDPESQRVADVENAVLTLEGKSPEHEAAANLLQAMAKTEFINDSSELAGLMTKELPRHVDLGDRGVKQASFYVLRGTEAPAVLVEMGFLSHPADEVRLASKGFRRKLLDGVYAGILDFARRHHWQLEN